jgi:signal transduction histidine kinase/PAS domain-containing protein
MMHWQINPYALLLFASALVSAVVAVYAWRRRPAPGAIPLVLLGFGAAEWSLGYAVATGFEDLPVRILLAKAQYLGIAIVPLSVFMLALQYVGREKWVTLRNIVLLAIVPVLTVLLAWTNERHGLIWADLKVVPYGSAYILNLEYGTFFWFYTVYAYVQVAIAIALLVDVVVRSSRLQRLQSLTILLGTLLPLLGNFSYIADLNPFPYLDLTPFGYSLSGLVILWGLFRYHLLDIVPVAHDTVIKSMVDGMLVLDVQDRAVDLNPAMQDILNVPNSRAVGQSASSLLGSCPDLLRCLQGGADAPSVITLERGGAYYHYDLRISPLIGRRDRLTGRLIVLRDVTARLRAEEALQLYADRLEAMRGIDQSILAARSAETIAVAAAGKVRYVVPCQRVVITEIVGGEQVKKLAAESSGEIALGADVDAYSELFRDHSLRQGKIIGCEDLAALSHRSSMQQMLYEEGIRSYVVVPLSIEGELIGALHLEAAQPKAFATEHVDAATEIAVLLAVGIRQARLYERAQREIIERKQAQAALRQRTIELESQNAELDAFAHTVAHDLKNPLSSIMGYADLLADLAQDDGSAGQWDIDLIAQQIAEGAESMDRIIESLMLLAGMRKQDVVLGSLDMASIVAKVLRSLTGLVDGYQAEIVLPDSWPTALGYEPWIEVVWSNYISNAIKYGGRPPHVEVGATVRDDGIVRFWVRDNGRGLSLDDQARLFAPFERLSHVRVAGHGLGLSIVRRIVDKLGGEVGVESGFGQGSEFWFSLRGA